MRWVVLTCLFVCSPSYALIIDGGSVYLNGNEYGTFYDDITGLTWLDLNAFTGSTRLIDIPDALEGTDFRFAEYSEFEGLRSALPGDCGSQPELCPEFQEEFDYYSQIMGNDNATWMAGIFYVNRSNVYPDSLIIFGESHFYNDPLNPYWFTDLQYTRADMTSAEWGGIGAWVVSDVAAVPIPGAVWLFLTGLGLFGVRAKLQPNMI